MGILDNVVKPSSKKRKTGPQENEIPPPEKNCDQPDCGCVLYFLDGSPDGPRWKCAKHRSHEYDWESNPVPPTHRFPRKADLEFECDQTDGDPPGNPPGGNPSSDPPDSPNYDPTPADFTATGIPQCPSPDCRCPMYWRGGYNDWHCVDHDPPKVYRLAAKVVDVRELSGSIDGGDLDPPGGHPAILGEDINSEKWWTENLIFEIVTREPNTGDNLIDGNIRRSLDDYKIMRIARDHRIADR